jgi:hypothetical protein
VKFPLLYQQEYGFGLTQYYLRGTNVTITNLLDEKKTAEILGLSVQTLRNDRATLRRIPYVKIGKSVRYRPEDLAELIEAHRVTGQG